MNQLSVWLCILVKYQFAAAWPTVVLSTSTYLSYSPAKFLVSKHSTKRN